MTLKELHERKKTLAGEIRKQADKINAESRDFTAEEKTAWEKVNADYDANERQIAIAERALAVAVATEEPAGDRTIGRPDYNGQDAAARDAAATGGDGAETAPTEEARALAFQAWCRWQLGHHVTDTQERACKQLKFNFNSRGFDVPLWRSEDYRQVQERIQRIHPSRLQDELRAWSPEKRALSDYIGPSGAYTVAPEALVRRLEINMLYFGGMQQVAEIIRTTTGERMRWPTADNTTIKGVQVGENVSYGTESDPTFAAVFWDAYKFSSTPILVPYELLEDSAFNMVNVLGDMLGERLGRILNDKYTTGSGAATPNGIITAASAFTPASSTALFADDLIGLIHSIDPAYRVMGCSFMMHDSILLIIRKLKDGFGQYLWQSGLQQGVPDRLLSYGLTINQSMDSTVSSGKQTVLFGRLNNYKIRKVGNLRMYRLEERFRDTDQDGFVAFVREDGNLLTAGTAPVKVIKH